MDFRIADTFTDSLARLTGEEQKAVKTTAFDLQMNPANPGMSFHKLDRARDKSFWSVRVNSDIRLIVHKTSGSLLLCYVDHHDKAYDWAERRKIETHPSTGAAQIVEIRETVKEIVVPMYVQKEIEKPATAPKLLFEEINDQALLDFGVPPEWLNDVKLATEDSLFALVDHLPAEAAEALLELATGGTPRKPAVKAPDTDPFEHPDAKRRFRVMSDQGELERALDYPWEKWTVFLHPDQKDIVGRTYSGPARVGGSAGTGKTIVALHRAVHLLRTNPDSRVLLTTFSDTLASALHTRLKRLISNTPRLGERIDVLSLDAVSERLHKALIGPVKIATRDDIRNLLREAARAVPDHKYQLPFLLSEWSQVVDAWNLATFDEYKTVPRLGRRTRLSEPKRQLLWDIFERVRVGLSEKGLSTRSAVFRALSKATGGARNKPYDFAVIDEAQDLGIGELRFMASLAGDKPDGLFFAGDIGQRIFQQPFSWKGLGVDIRGRSKTLRVNYRTSHQIREHADRLLNSEIVDADGNAESRADTVSLFNGPAPEILKLGDEAAEVSAVSKWIADQSSSGLQPHEIGVFVRSDKEVSRAVLAATDAGVPYKILDEHVEVASGHISISTMHLAKGLEFRAVAVMACDEEVIPSPERIQNIGEEGDLEDAYNTERQLLYVACTRARDQLLVTCVEPGSEFLSDLVR